MWASLRAGVPVRGMALRRERAGAGGPWEGLPLVGFHLVRPGVAGGSCGLAGLLPGGVCGGGGHAFPRDAPVLTLKRRLVRRGWASLRVCSARCGAAEMGGLPLKFHCLTTVLLFFSSRVN